MMNSYFVLNDKQWKTRLAVGMLLFWFITSFLYIELNQIQRFQFIAGLILLVSQSGLGILIAIIAFELANKSSKIYRSIFVFFGLAFFVEAITDGNLNLNISVLNNYPLSNLIELSIEIPFFIFHIFLFASYLQMLMKSKTGLSKKGLYYSGFELLPFAFVVLAVLYFFVFSYQWEIDALSVSGIIQIIAIVLDLVGFFFAIICLAASNYFSILCISTGVLILVTTDIIDRFNVLSSSYLLSNYVNDIMWPLGLLTVLYGLLFLRNSKVVQSENLKLLLPINSVQVQYTLWCFLVSVFSLSAFILIALPFIDKNDLHHNTIVKYTSSMLMVFSAISVLFSSLFAKKMAAPFDKIKFLFNSVMNVNYEEIVSSGADHTAVLKNEKIEILEFAELSNFVTQSFYAFKEKTYAEKRLSQAALQVAHDIRSPLTALDMVIRDISDLPEDQRILVRNATNSICDIANNLLTQYDKKNSLGIKQTITKYEPELIVDLVLNVISEKRVQFKNSPVEFIVDISDPSYGIFSIISASEFKRV